MRHPVLLVVMLTAGCTVPALYSSDAGFPRDQTITVATPPFPVSGLEAGIAYWNALAGRNIFKVGPTGDITIYPALRNGTNICGAGNVACAAPVGTDGQYRDPPAYPYASCQIYVTDTGAVSGDTLAHELGHCLGFNHHDDGHPSVMNGAGRSAYLHDGMMLLDAGYRS